MHRKKIFILKRKIGFRKLLIRHLWRHTEVLKCSLVTFLMVTFITHQAVAIVVTDPGAYARLAQQAATLTDMLKKADATIERIDNLEKQVSGVTQFGSDFSRHIQKVKWSLVDMTSSLGSMKDSLNLPTIDGLKVNVGTDLLPTIQQQLDTIFVPPSRDPYGVAYEPAKEHYRQTSWKASLEQAELVLVNAAERFGHIKQLSTMMDKTETMKQSQDLTNRMLAELLVSQQKIVHLLAHLNRVTAVRNYNGVEKSYTAPEPIERPWKTLHTASFSTKGSKFPPIFRDFCDGVIKSTGKC